MKKIADRKSLAFAFSERLVSLLKQKGFQSHTAVSGVKIKILSEKLDCSVQIARRYTLGEALPEPEQLLKMAQWLEVSPGWLLFGEEKINNKGFDERLNIDPDLLRYILIKMQPFFSNTSEVDAVVEFTLDLLYDASHLKTTKNMLHKMIDMAIHSAERFHKKKRKIA
ncbi:MAG: hypothetical protein HY939_07740 [Gammaproteobacteria bacterium]|nr:hypothetical protein [Gammaproteobacteria bacterium]